MLQNVKLNLVEILCTIGKNSIWEVVMTEIYSKFSKALQKAINVVHHI